MKFVLVILLFLVPLRSFTQEKWSNAPGQTLLYYNNCNFTRVEVRGQFREQDKASVPVEGAGLRQGEFNAWARHSLDSLKRVEGGVSYQRGVKLGVKMNSSSDWSLLQPYVVLDSVGGDLQREQYRFWARYAARYGRFIWSVHASFRALHEYREVDPRPRNITSDLVLGASAGVVAGEYALSLEAAYRKYHQSCSVQFMDPSGSNATVVQSLGFGRYFTRFSGAKKSTATRFQGSGYSVQGRLEPTSGQGWLAGAGYNTIYLARHLPDFNEVPVSTVLREEATLYGGKKWAHSYVVASLDGVFKRGYENVIDQSSAFLSLGALQMYRQYSLRASIVGYNEWAFKKVNLGLQPMLAACYTAAGDAISAMDFMAWQAGLNLEISYRLSRKLSIYAAPRAQFTLFGKNNWFIDTMATIGIEF